ncbi:helix-turn-helix transcriptional regulator [Streptomyces sp. NPDC019396]|uniref:helix-turn-helix transcriptional regulator n=1 Tax=Streptomyces sp. NPDC019396 TaxID=3154687 RepID=UPI0033E77C08
MLDEASLTVLGHLIEARFAFVIFVMDGGKSSRNEVSHLIYRDSIYQLELQYIDLETVEATLSAALEGLVGPRTAEYFFNACGGNFLYLRELLIGSLRSGNIEFNGVMWEITGTQGPTPRLVELVERRLKDLPPDSWCILETLALCGQTSLTDLSGSIKHLESAGLVSVIRHGRRNAAELTHPVYAEVIRSHMTPSSRSAVLLAEAERIRESGARRAADFRYIAKWELDARGVADSYTLMQGSKAARRVYGYSEVKALAEAACRIDGSFMPRLLLGEALYELGEIQRSLSVLREATTRASNETERIYAVLALERALCWGKADVEAALELNDEASERAHAPESRDILSATRGIILAAIGKIPEAMNLLSGLERLPNARIRALGQPTLALCLTLLGRSDEGLILARKAHGERLELIEATVLPHPSQNVGPVACALQESGHLTQAYMLLLKGWDDAVDDEDPECLTMLASSLSRAALLEGRARTARRWASQAVALAKRHNFMGPLYPAWIRLAEAAALMQDKEAAKQALLAAEGMKAWGTFAPELCLGQVWLSAVSGDLADARNKLIESISYARTIGHHCSEARLLTDLCRVGGQKQAADRLERMAQDSSNQLTKIRSRFATAMHRSSPEDLMNSANECKAAGAFILAAEAASSAAGIWRHKGDSRRATASLRMMNQMKRQCEDVWTPGIFFSTEEVPLTTRELEIALMVAEGHTNAEVAEKLVLSKRTVDNHLLSVFRKLGIETRRDLKEALSK